MKRAVKVLALLAALSGVMVVALWLVAARRGASHLVASVRVEKADLGIPGVTKTYEAVLTNEGLWPARITRCDFMDDSSARGVEVAYAIQRWDGTAKDWKTVLSPTLKTFCHPYPLGMVQAQLKRAWLWPGQSIGAGDEATAAREHIEKGDRVRFLIFTSTPGDTTASLPTEDFSIDEHSTSDVDFRVRH